MLATPDGQAEPARPTPRPKGSLPRFSFQPMAFAASSTLSAKPQVLMTKAGRRGARPALMAFSRRISTGSTPMRSAIRSIWRSMAKRGWGTP